MAVKWDQIYMKANRGWMKNGVRFTHAAKQVPFSLFFNNWLHQQPWEIKSFTMDAKREEAWDVKKETSLNFQTKNHGIMGPWLSMPFGIHS
ncbi:unnamed protein product [Sphenostylis stenocarpa]|uniref:Uncharacterized protein n=1 Tax=Sphenostylis stenocarpa TaxID=92480 RepID=A0AA86SR05_9FABA|nr:unnamed protein product [Sphenostylis stenocarpa]